MTMLFLTGCDEWMPAKTRQASLESCQFTWGVFKEQMNEAKYAEGIDKIYYAQMGQMNLSTLLAKGCCNYPDTCPAAITE
jgi:hypothetical protein